VCAENFIRIDDVTEHLSWQNDRLLLFVLAILASAIKSQTGLEAENAVLRR
jgi:hypothetical protein